MKKISLLLFLSVSFTLAFGKSVPVSTARTVGFNYLHGKVTTLNSEQDLSLVYTSGEATPYFYVFSGSNCFVIVSADDAVNPIIGYATNNYFRGDRVPSNASAFFKSYNNQIRDAVEHNTVATPEIAAKWDNILKSRNPDVAARTTAVSPLLSTKWDQYPYYNAYTPADPGAGSFGGHDVTGCVATATSQVMKFWNWPAHGVGMHSYVTSSYGTLSANFGSTTYNWAAMPVPSATGANADVARLMSDVGIAVDMNYTSSESGAFVIQATSPITNCAEYALKTYFDYKTTMHGEPRSSYPSDATWTAMLRADLDAGRPIIYDGAGGGGGHCFVLDGYDGSGNFHINFGWSGFDDGYYSINAINPSSVGTGGGSGDYNSNQEAILGVEPNSGGTTVVPSLALYDFVNISPSSTINYIQSFTVTTNIENIGTSTFNGDFCAAAFNASTGTFITYIDSVMGASLPSTYVFSSSLTFNTAGLVALVPGTYTVGIFYRPTGGSWAAVTNAGSYTNFVPLTVVNSNFIELKTAITAAPNPLVQGSPATITYKLYNNSATTWSDSLYLGLYDLSGNWVCDIQGLPATTIGAYATTGTLTFSTSSVTASPGTYLLVPWYKSSGSWYLTGADYVSNPININVVAPPPAPDVYEVNNTAATAYDLSSTLTWVSNAASTGTPGANFHVPTDQDYYKITLAPGYNYAISASVDDDVNPGTPYTVDAVWSYSTDGGSTWSAVFNNTMTGAISLSNGGTVIFHVSPHYAGDIGAYLFKVSNITRTLIVSVPQVNLSEVNIYPNPAKDFVNIDLSGTGTQGTNAVLTDMQGKQVFKADIAGQPVISIPVGSLSEGMYFLSVTTEAGMINRKITVSK